jgi:transcriptional regulator with XRE-family HTH domain
MKGPVDLDLAHRLAELREHAGLSLAELADASTVNKSTIHRYEHGKIHIPVQRLNAFAAAMHVDRRYALMPPGAPLPKLPPNKQRFRS